MKTKNLLRTLILSILAASAASPVAAQALLPETVVTATRLETPLEEVASSITVITRADIEAKQQRTIVDVLSSVPGLRVVQSGGLGKQTSVFSRGSNSNHTLILVDGIEVSDASTPNGAFNFAHLLTSDIERIEVVRGPQSTLFGSDAIGAVVNITTTLGSGPAQYLAQVEGGSFDTAGGALKASGSKGNLRYAFGTSYLDSDGESVSPARIRALQAGATEEDDGYTYKSFSDGSFVQTFGLIYLRDLSSRSPPCRSLGTIVIPSMCRVSRIRCNEATARATKRNLNCKTTTSDWITTS